MINIQKQIDYWINGADDDIKTAELLIRESDSSWIVFLSSGYRKSYLGKFR